MDRYRSSKIFGDIFCINFGLAFNSPTPSSHCLIFLILHHLLVIIYLIIRISGQKETLLVCTMLLNLLNVIISSQFIE